MDCTICGKQVVNENNQLQKKVKDFLKTVSKGCHHYQRDKNCAKSIRTTRSSY